MSIALGVIPARWGSTRFPGKALALIAGKPMIQRVIERALRAKRLSRVLVATDDERIAVVARACGVEAVMTPSNLASGTDRVAAAVRGQLADIVLNIQGDEPLADPAAMDKLVAALEESDWDIATPACPLSDPSRQSDPTVVKVVFAQDGRALYFSRSLIPYVRDPEEARAGEVVYWQHVGLYAYRRAALDRFVAAPPSPLERLEKLEQLRALELGMRIRVVPTERPGVGVDVPEDVARVEKLLREENA